MVALFATALLGLLFMPVAQAAPARPGPAASPAPPRWASQRVMELDPTGSGRAVVALGDPSRARHIAVIVPGVGINLGTFDEPGRPERRPFGMAQAVRGLAPDTAVIAWLGYRPPSRLNLDAVGGDRARQGAAALRAFVGRLRARAVPGATIGVICHSYGTTVCGLAAAGLPVDDLALLASPGVRADHVADLHTRARVWAGTAEDDWIRWVPHIRIGDWGHGPDPAEREFGARPLPTAGVRGHDGYFAPDSVTLRALAAIAAGRFGTAPRPIGPANRPSLLAAP
ncbi:hypothetical protein GCM10023321_61830 [Pseudonocardia eucalypti]|uniref:DUF1023 domain-containing protein n=1 Tax=Pseudonocardia eucalypti TaxID=648755 RepID=A0ABP9QVZ5_9PSEU